MSHRGKRQNTTPRSLCSVLPSVAPQICAHDEQGSVCVWVMFTRKKKRENASLIICPWARIISQPSIENWQVPNLRFTSEGIRTLISALTLAFPHIRSTCSMLLRAPAGRFFLPWLSPWEPEGAHPLAALPSSPHLWISGNTSEPDFFFQFFPGQRSHWL